MDNFEYFIVYDTTSGQMAYSGSCTAGSAALQPLDEGQALMRVPRQAIATPGTIDMDAIKASYAASIDADADKVRSMFITNTPGQMATYLEKEAEARRVLAGDEGPTVFLGIEAEALGMNVSDLAVEVVAQADQWRPIGARIEAARRKAKVEVQAADNLAALAAAAQIDWQAVTAPAA